MLTKPIPKKLIDEMEADPFYQQCCMTGASKLTSKIEWHHNFKWKGQRLNEKWCILPLLKKIHDKADTTEVKERLDRIMLNRADEKTLRKYSKAEDLIAKRDRLNAQYANKENHTILSRIPF